MRASFVLIGLFFLSLTTAVAGDNTRKAGAAAPAATVEGTATTVSLRGMEMLRAAQRQQAVMLATEFSRVLALPAGATRQELEVLMFTLFQAPAASEMAATPALPEIDPETGLEVVPVVSAPLARILTAHTAEFQHLLAPVLPQASYDRYVALLDKLEIHAK